MQVRGPRFDGHRQRVAARGQCCEIAADAEQSAARRNQHRAHIVTLAQFCHAKVELAAEVAVDRIAAVGLIENDMREASVDRAFEARGSDCQTHCVSPRRFRLIDFRPTGLPFPCAWRLEWPPARAASLPAKVSKAPRTCSAPPDDARHRY